MFSQHLIDMLSIRFPFYDLRSNWSKTFRRRTIMRLDFYVVEFRDEIESS